MAVTVLFSRMFFVLLLVADNPLRVPDCWSGPPVEAERGRREEWIDDVAAQKRKKLGNGFSQARGEWVTQLWRSKSTVFFF